ncbi:LppP/LprE family lipoprotein [Schaalia sp. 19OD2882]|uniref:LppP/LprE family lipoprotein n=1 Tax=Schaalia sp. 19OD2882 TaxID=2794089 RepID=UPI001C1ED756|nr:LppP/LprE family lipoprotein [Schaalia sp. 19OD2882]QWW18843.1 LppP/LprE family lipoprotein [Schaalia sp. 19OD2882]
MALFAGCAPSDGGPSEAPSSSSDQSAASGASTTQSAPDEAASDSACANLTGAQALATWGPKVAQAWPDLPLGDPLRWDLKEAPVDTYDPCSPVSWIVLSNTSGAVSGPRHIMLFHEGTYVGTATAKPLAYQPAILRKAPDTLSLTFPFAQKDDDPAKPTGSTTVELLMNPDGRATITGTVPAEAEPRKNDDLPSPVPGAWPGAGRAAPAQAQAPAKVLEAGATPFNRQRTAVFTTPSGNIVCDLTVGQGRCLVKSYQQDKTYGQTGGMTNWAVHSIGSADAAVGAQSEATPAWHVQDSLPSLDYGQVLSFGSMVCGSAETGLTCWNTETGHGAFINRTQTQFF